MTAPKFVPHSIPQEAERQLLIATASALRWYLRPSPTDPDGRDRIDHLERCLALVDAPRAFVCREHGRQFTSAAPCAACAGRSIATGFHLNGDGHHVVTETGRAACGDSLATGARVPKVSATAGICKACWAITPADVWSVDFTGAKP